jgi:DNA-directed RNA polymerase specialized sigma subunit
MSKKCLCNEYYTCKACRRIDIYTYAEIGDLLGLSHQRVQQIERRALQKFRNNLELLGYHSLEEVL